MMNVFRLKKKDTSSGEMMVYWNSNERNKKFPRLYSASRMIAIIQPTETPSERFFSKSGIMSSTRRFLLSNENLHKQTFINCNLK